MQSFLDLYDKWNGLLTAICGIYAMILAYGYEKSAVLEIGRACTVSCSVVM